MKQEDKDIFKKYVNIFDEIYSKTMKKYEYKFGDNQKKDIMYIIKASTMVSVHSNYSLNDYYNDLMQYLQFYKYDHRIIAIIVRYGGLIHHNAHNYKYDKKLNQGEFIVFKFFGYNISLAVNPFEWFTKYVKIENIDDCVNLKYNLDGSVDRDRISNILDLYVIKKRAFRKNIRE